MKRFLQATISEIRKDPMLRWYGVFLSLTHVIAYILWKTELSQFLSNEVAPICWPFWEDCYRYRVFQEGRIEDLLNLYLILSIIPLVLFLNSKWVSWAWWSLLILTLIRLGIIALDFRFRANALYMATWTTFVFLFLPDKRKVIGLLIAFFYFWAGTLKLNSIWLSGGGLYKPLWLIKEEWIPWACAYVVVLELFLIWGIFSKRSSIFWVTFLQLLIFHVMSWPLVGFLYPTVMYALLTVYPLTRLWPLSRGASNSNEFLNLLSGKQRPTTYAALGILGILQIQTYFFPGNASFTGEGRFLSLDMFDDRIECEAYAEIQNADGSHARRDLVSPMPPRIRCDPIVYFNRGRLLCRNLRDSGSLEDFDLVLNSRRLGTVRWKTVIHQVHFCESEIHYDLWRHNSWIRPVL